jgi:hypothetical protein
MRCPRRLTQAWPLAPGEASVARPSSLIFASRSTPRPEGVQNFAQLVKDKGTDALRRAMEKEDKGPKPVPFPFEIGWKTQI